MTIECQDCHEKIPVPPGKTPYCHGVPICVMCGYPDSMDYDYVSGRCGMCRRDATESA